MRDIRQKMVLQSDLILCGLLPEKSAARYGATPGFLDISQYLHPGRKLVRRINPKAVVMTMTQWSNSGIERWETTSNLVDYWKLAGEWAHNNSYRLYLREAVDNQCIHHPANDAHLGWWELNDASNFKAVDGYVEKILELMTPPVNEVSHTVQVESPILWTIAACITGTITVLIITSLVILTLYLLKQHGRLNATEIRDFIFGSNSKDTYYSVYSANDAMGCPYDKTLEIPKDKLEIDKNRLLGSGQFGIVFAGLLKQDDGEVIEVAVKVVRNNCPSIGLKGLLSEIKIMSFLGQHPNIVALIGAYTAELSRGIVNLATELCSLGSLQSFLRKKHGVVEDGPILEDMICEPAVNSGQSPLQIGISTVPNISFSDMVRWSYEIACGMEHLEKKHAIHGDLATRNVLLTLGKTAKIADFGLSSRIRNYTEYVKKSNGPLPWRWMAVESLKRMEFSSKSDVWSYGITLWEIFSMGDVPYPGVTWSEEFIADLVNGLRPMSPSLARPEFYKLMRICWDVEPRKRPTFSELVSYTNNWLHMHTCDNTDIESNYTTVEN